jgi:hypothetical protein
MSKFGDLAKSAFDFLTPDNQTERLTFRRFKGKALAKAAETGRNIASKDVDLVVLKLNPQEISYDQPKIISKVQTSAPGQFVVFDWGTDLLSMNISGNTGNLFPGIAESGGWNPLNKLNENVAHVIAPNISAKLGNVDAEVQNILLGSLTYSELLEMSPKFRTFRRLQNMYEIFDADLDVLTLEVGKDVYRGYFTSFAFSQTAENPWNWKYSISFIALTNLVDGKRRGDDDFPEDSSIIDLDQ